MHRIKQALVAIGGRASRLAPLVDVPVSKAFLQVGSEPAVNWCLGSLLESGVERVVLAADNERQCCRAQDVIDEYAPLFKSIELFRDPGLGVHGLPFHTLDMFDEPFIFEAGHSVLSPHHYRRLTSMSSPGKAVFSAFDTSSNLSRQDAFLMPDGTCSMLPFPEARYVALAHPMIIDQEYAASLPSFRFKVGQIAAYYAQRGDLVASYSDEPPEFDTPDEYRALLQIKG